MIAANKQELPNFQDAEASLASSIRSSYPDNFYIGKAIGNGSCFFDSFRQSLEQQTGKKVTIKQLRENCKKFAQDNPPEWFAEAIANSLDINGFPCGETLNSYAASITANFRWGDPDIEGRILCGKYGVKLHVVERQVVNNEHLFLHQLIDSSGSKNIGLYTRVSYDDSSVLHIINKGNTHFEPLLDIEKTWAKELKERAKVQQEQGDFVLAKELQIDEILEYCNISNDPYKEGEVERIFDKLLTKNLYGKISDVVEQCVSYIELYLKRSEEEYIQHSEELFLQHSEKRCVQHAEEPRLGHSEELFLQHSEKPRLQHSEKRCIKHSEEPRLGHSEELFLQHSEKPRLQHSEKRCIKHSEEPRLWHSEELFLQHSEKPRLQHSEKRCIKHSEEPRLWHSEQLFLQHPEKPRLRHSEKRCIKHSEEPRLWHSEQLFLQHPEKPRLRHSEKRCIKHSKELFLQHSEERCIQHPEELPLHHSEKRYIQHSGEQIPLSLLRSIVVERSIERPSDLRVSYRK